MEAGHVQSRVAYEARPWGWFEILQVGRQFQVKILTVEPGAQLSLQKHQHRAEHWIVVRGMAEVRIGDSVQWLGENETAFVPQGAVHRLSNRGAELLQVVEVQFGSYLGEDDITRLADIYARPTRSG